VIIKFQLTSKLNVDDTVYSSASTLSWMRINVVDGHKFLVVEHLSLRLVD